MQYPTDLEQQIYHALRTANIYRAAQSSIVYPPIAKMLTDRIIAEQPTTVQTLVAIWEACVSDIFPDALKGELIELTSIQQ